jgi:hypothetical protein
MSNEHNERRDRPAVQLAAESTTRGEPAALTNGGLSSVTMSLYLPKAVAPASNDLKKKTRRQNDFGEPEMVEAH